MKIKETSQEEYKKQLAENELKLLGRPKLTIGINPLTWEIIPWWYYREAEFSYVYLDFHIRFLCFVINYSRKYS